MFLLLIVPPLVPMDLEITASGDVKSRLALKTLHSGLPRDYLSISIYSFSNFNTSGSVSIGEATYTTLYVEARKSSSRSRCSLVLPRAYPKCTTLFCSQSLVF